VVTVARRRFRCRKRTRPPESERNQFYGWSMVTGSNRVTGR
jgi:hypothetical protein